MKLALLKGLCPCLHRHLTRPFTSRPRGLTRLTYVVCLDCGRQFGYDLDRMRVGKAIQS